MNHSAKELYLRHHDTILILVLVIFYTVGTAGILMESQRQDFLELSAMNLLLSLGVLIAARKTLKQLFLIYLFICFITGMLTEWIGTHTGWLFGHYEYGPNLGAKIGGVPLIIGINWGILSVTSCTVIAHLPRIGLKAPVYKALASALVMMALDVLIEPVAIDSDYWHWYGLPVPLYNYICWFAIAFPLHFVYFRWKLDEQNRVSIALWIIMVIFFTILNFR